LGLKFLNLFGMPLWIRARCFGPDIEI